MRFWVITFLMVLMPLQFSWAATGQYCQHEKDMYKYQGAEFHVLALKFVATYEQAVTGADDTPARLTRREIQCLKWAAAGKTDAEIGELVAISLPTVRFHVTNAARKLRAGGRSQAIQRAAILGYIGSGGPGAASRPVRTRAASE